MIYITGDTHREQDVFKIIGEYSDKIIDIICWTKTNPMPASGFNVTNSWEFILVMSDKEKSIKAQRTYTKNHIETSVYSENPYKKIHRAVMKPDVVEWFLDRFTEENDVIFDCFMGVGTTGVSCLENNRKFIGVELDNTYFNISKERLGKLRFPLPPLELQEQFADFVKQVDKSKVVVQKAFDETQMLYDSLLQEYFG